MKDGLSTLMLEDQQEYGKSKVLRDLYITSVSPLSKTKKTLRDVFRKQDLEPRSILLESIENLKSFSAENKEALKMCRPLDFTSELSIYSLHLKRH